MNNNLKKCPICRYKVKPDSGRCPLCEHKFSKMDYINAKNIIIALIAVILVIFFIYNGIVIAIFNSQLNRYSLLDDISIEQVEILEEKYENLSQFQKKFVRGSQIKYMREDIEEYSKIISVEEEKIMIYFDDGSREALYTGNIQNDAPIGEGIVTFYNKYGELYTYTGEIDNSRLTGNGTLVSEDGKNTYSGMFLNGDLNGEGKHFDENGTLIYEGEFVNNLYSGEGTIYASDGTKIYSGQFSDGRPDEYDYANVCKNVTPVQLYSGKTEYQKSNVAVTGVITDILLGDDNKIQYVIANPANIYSNNVCVKYRGRSYNINIGDTVVMYGFIRGEEDYTMSTGENKHGLVQQAYNVRFIALSGQ